VLNPSNPAEGLFVEVAEEFAEALDGDYGQSGIESGDADGVSAGAEESDDEDEEIELNNARSFLFRLFAGEHGR